MHCMCGPSEEVQLVNKFHVFYEIINFITFQILQDVMPWRPVKKEAEDCLQDYVMS